MGIFAKNVWRISKMYQLEIIQRENVIRITDVDIDVLVQFVKENIGLFGPETKFSISEM